MSSVKPKARYQVLPLPRVQREAKKLLSTIQLREGIQLAKLLRYYPETSDLSLEPCGLGFELRLDHPKIGQQGWLRSIFWIHEAKKTIYVVDLFWKKTNRISVADQERANHRIRQLKLLLEAGGNPWKSSE
jgi:phage-related protein